MLESRSSLARRGPVLLVILLYLALGARFLETVPAWEAPDEPWHLVYAEALAEGRLPRPEESYEQHHPPLYYLWPALAIRAMGTGPVVRSPDNPRFPFAAAAYLHPPDEPGRGQLHLLRAFSGLLGSLLIALTWAIGRRAAPRDRAPALVAASIVAFWPQLQLIAQAVSNDLLAAILGAWLAYWMLRLAGQGPEDRGAAGGLRLGLALGLGWSLALLCKLNLVFILPALGLSVFLAARSLSRWSTSVSDLRGLILAGLLCLGMPALAWLALVTWLPGVSDALVAQLGGRGVDFAPELARPDRVASAAILMLDHAWGRPGWFNVDLPVGARRAVSLLALLSLAGLPGVWRSSGRQGRGAMLLAIALSALAFAAALRNLMSDPQSQARLMFPAIATFAWLLTIGSTEWAAWAAKVTRAGWGGRADSADPQRRWWRWWRSGSPLSWLLPSALLALSLFTTESLLPRAFAQEAQAAFARVDSRVIAPAWELVSVDAQTGAVVQAFAPQQSGMYRVELPVLLAKGEGRLLLRLFASPDPAEASAPLAESSLALKDLGRPDIARPRIGPLADATWVGVEVRATTIPAGALLRLQIEVVGTGRISLPAYGDPSTYAAGDLSIAGTPVGDLVFVVYGRAAEPVADPSAEPAADTATAP